MLITSVINSFIFQVNITVFKDFFQTIPYLLSFSKLFKTLKISTINSRTFLTFPDLYKSWIYRQKDRQIAASLDVCPVQGVESSLDACPAQGVRSSLDVCCPAQGVRSSHDACPAQGVGYNHVHFDYRS